MDLGFMWVFPVQTANLKTDLSWMCQNWVFSACLNARKARFENAKCDSGKCFVLSIQWLPLSRLHYNAFIRFFVLEEVTVIVFRQYQLMIR